MICLWQMNKIMPFPQGKIKNQNIIRLANGFILRPAFFVFVLI